MPRQLDNAPTTGQSRPNQTIPQKLGNALKTRRWPENLTMPRKLSDAPKTRQCPNYEAMPQLPGKAPISPMAPCSPTGRPDSSSPPPIGTQGPKPTPNLALGFNFKPGDKILFLGEEATAHCSSPFRVGLLYSKFRSAPRFTSPHSHVTGDGCQRQLRTTDANDKCKRQTQQADTNGR